MASTPEMDEKDLLVRMRDGDVAAFNHLYERYKKRLAGKLIRLLKSDELVQDVMQELFAKLWEVRNTVDPEQAFDAFIFRMATNQVLNTFRKIKRDENMRANVAMASSAFYAPIEENLHNEERKDMLYRAMDKLPARQREVLMLHKLEGRSAKEISERLNISISAINNHVYRAMKELGKILSRNPITVIIALSTLFMQYESL